MTTNNTTADNRYVPEKPCRRGHYLRWRTSGACVACTRLKERENYAAARKATGKAPRPPRKDSPTEPFMGLVELLKPDRLAALHLTRQLISQALIEGPVRDTYINVIYDQLRATHKWMEQGPPLPPQSLTQSPRTCSAS